MIHAAVVLLPVKKESGQILSQVLQPWKWYLYLNKYMNISTQQQLWNLLMASRLRVTFESHHGEYSVHLTWLLFLRGTKLLPNQVELTKHRGL